MVEWYKLLLLVAVNQFSVQLLALRFEFLTALFVELKCLL